MAGASEATAPLALSTRDVPRRPGRLRCARSSTRGAPHRAPVRSHPRGGSREVAAPRGLAPRRPLRRCAAIGFPGAGDDDVFFGINESGASLARQCGNDVAIEAGEAIALDLGDGPFAVLRPVATRMIGLRLDRRLLLRDRPDAVPALRPVSAGSAALRLLARYLRAVLDGDELASPLSRRSSSGTPATSSPWPSHQSTPGTVRAQLGVSAPPTPCAEGGHRPPPHRWLSQRRRSCRSAPDHTAIPAPGLRGRREDLQPVRSRRPPRPGPPSPARSTPRGPDGHLDRARRRLRGRLLLEPNVPDALGITR